MILDAADWKKIALWCGGFLLLGWVTFADLSATHGSLFAWVVNGDHTTFAAGYSEAGFSAVHPGLTTGSVLKLLGEPLLRIDDGYRGYGLEDDDLGQSIIVGEPYGDNGVWLYSGFNRRHDGGGRGRQVRRVSFSHGQVTGTQRYYEPDW